jgi:hypothetical protein
MSIAGRHLDIAVPQKMLNGNNVDSRTHETLRTSTEHSAIISNPCRVFERRLNIDRAVTVPHIAVRSARTRVPEVGDAAEYSASKASLACGIFLVEEAVAKLSAHSELP